MSKVTNFLPTLAVFAGSGSLARLGPFLQQRKLKRAFIVTSRTLAGMRTTDVGWAAAMGRCGSIIGPAVGGLLLAAGLDGQSIVLTMLVPMLLASAISAVLWSLDSQVKDEDVLTVPN